MQLPRLLPVWCRRTLGIMQAHATKVVVEGEHNTGEFTSASGSWLR